MDMTLSEAFILFHNNDTISARVEGNYIHLRTPIYSQFGEVIGMNEVKVHFIDLIHVEKRA